jgi:hypothetical protein
VTRREGETGIDLRRNLNIVMRAFLLLLALVLVLPTAAQEVGTRQRVVLTGGRVIVGTVVATSGEAVVLDVDGVRTEIPRAQIVRISDVTGRFTRNDPNDTRLFITPTGRTLPRGAGRLTTYFVFPSVAYGVTGNLDVSAAASIPVDGNGLVSATAKVGVVQREALALAAGASASTFYGDNSDLITGTVYGVGTFGTPERSLTLGAYGISATGGEAGGVEVGDGMGVVIGGGMQISNSVKLMTENALIFAFTDEGGTAGILAAGVRFFGDRLTADVALPVYAFVTENDFRGNRTVEGKAFPLPFPYVGFAYNFGR